MKTSLIMTEERKNDNETIKEIIQKTRLRANAKLTDREKEIMTKYNLERNGGDLYSSKNHYKNTFALERNMHFHRYNWTHHGKWDNVDFVGYFTSEYRIYSSFIREYSSRNTFQENQRRIEENAFRHKTMEIRSAKGTMKYSKAMYLKVETDYENQRRKLIEALANLEEEKKKEKEYRLGRYKANYENFKRLCETYNNSIDILAR